MVIGKTIYEITAEEKDGVKPTPLIILQELIDRHLCEAIYSPDCCLEFDGGMKRKYNYNIRRKIVFNGERT